MATVDKAFRVKNGLVVEGATATVNTHDVITKEIFDAKGDLIVGTGSNTGTRVAVGTNGYVLTADSAETNGVKWAAAPAVGAFETSIVFEGTTANDFETTLTVTDPTADNVITFQDATGTVALLTDIPSTAGMVTETDTQTLTNKTLTSPVVSGLSLSDSSIVFEGSSADDNETTLTVTNPTGDRTITLPDATGTVITTGNLHNITEFGVLTSAIVMEGTTANDFELTISAGDPTADRTVTLPDATGTVALLTATQTFTNSKLTGSSYDSNIVDPTLVGPLKLEGGSYGVTIASSGDRENFKTWSFGTDGVLSAPGNIIFEGATANDYETTLAITDPTADRTITLPDATGTVALTNNKLDAFAATTSAELAGVISDETGTGALVFANTPTLVTPNIGEATGTSLTLSGDLTVNGTTTTINSTEITIDDKNLTLGSVATPTDAGADGGGITLKGATDKTINWVDATDAWTFSEHVNLASGKSYYANGTLLKDVSETLTNKTLTSPTVSGLTLSDGSIVIEGSTANDFETTLTVTDPTGDRTITFQDATGTVAFTSDITVSASSTNTFTNKSIALSTNTVTGTLAEFNTAVTDADFVSLAGTETLTNKTLTSPILTTPDIGAATATSITLTDALMGSATTSLSTTSATVVDSWSATTYSSAKYIVQMKNGGDIEVLEVLVTVNGANNVYITEYADVQSNAQIGTTDADYSGGNVRLLVTATDGTTVKVHKTLIEA